MRRRKTNVCVFCLSRPFAAIGIVWAGDPTDVAIVNVYCRRRGLLPLLRTPGLKFYSLQKGGDAVRSRRSAVGYPVRISIHSSWETMVTLRCCLISWILSLVWISQSPIGRSLGQMCGRVELCRGLAVVAGR